VHNHKAVGRGPDFGLIPSHHHRSLVFIFSLVLSDRGKCKRSGKRENGNGGGGGGGKNRCPIGGIHSDWPKMALGGVHPLGKIRKSVGSVVKTGSHA